VRTGIIERVDREIAAHREHGGGRIRLKMNALVDEQVIDALYRAWGRVFFARGAARWEEAKALQVDTASLAWLGPEAASLGSIARRGRTRLDGMEMSGALVNGRWTDGVPFLLERPAGRGLTVTAGLPASLDESDFALRPGFIALLDQLLRQAGQREGGRRTAADTPQRLDREYLTWLFA